MHHAREGGAVMVSVAKGEALDAAGQPILVGDRIADRFGVVWTVLLVIGLQVFVSPNAWVHPANCRVVS